MTHGNGGQQRPPRVPDAIGTRDGGDAFAAVFDGEAPGTIEPYVRLVPPPADGPTPGIPPNADQPLPSGPRGPVFDPADVEHREYRLLARALTNDDEVTEHLAAMTLVQLVKFLRAAGVSVPYFPDTGDTADPGPNFYRSVGHAPAVDTSAV